MKKFFIVLAAVVLFHPAGSFAGSLKVVLVLSERGGAYQEYGNALGASLLNKNFTLSVIEAGEPLPAADLFITAGMKASLIVVRGKPAAMLAVLIPREGFEKLKNDMPEPDKRNMAALSAIYLDQPYKRQLDLISAILPRTNSIAVMYASPPRDLPALRTLVAARKLMLNERVVTTETALHTALQGLLQSSDVLLALPDSEVYNTLTIRNILLATYRSNVPLIGFSPGYVKAGALCAVFSTPGQIAAQSLGVIQEYAKTHMLPEAQYSKEFDVSVNEQVSRSLGLNIKSATQLRGVIGAAP